MEIDSAISFMNRTFFSHWVYQNGSAVLWLTSIYHTFSKDTTILKRLYILEKAAGIPIASVLGVMPNTDISVNEFFVWPRKPVYMP